MKRVRVALTKSQLEAIKTPRSAKALVEGMNREIGFQKNEIEGLRANYADLQNKYETTRSENQALDKDNGILHALQGTFWLVEAVKFVISGLAGYGVNIATTGKAWGWIEILVSTLAYGAITFIQSRYNTSKQRAPLE